MSTRIHWLRPIDQRITACGRNAFHSDFFDGSAAEYLGVSNFCVKCELAAQKEHGSGKPKRIPAPQWPEPRPIEQYTGDKPVLGFCPSQDWLTIRPDRSTRTGRIIGWLTTCPSEAFVAPTHFLTLPPAPEVRK